MPRRSKRRTRRKRGGDKECNEIAHTICGDVKNFKTEFDMTGQDEHAVYATRFKNEYFPCTLVVDKAGKPILKKDEYNRTDDEGNIRMHEQYVDPTGKACYGKEYSSRVPYRNIEDCKHGFGGSSQIFKECHYSKKQKLFPGKNAYLDERDLRSSKNSFGRSDLGLVGGRWLFSHKSRKKKRKRTKKKRRRKKKKTRKRRRKRRR